jgi:prepilin-type N-terminal cleavage/methylation domain-containing protein
VWRRRPTSLPPGNEEGFTLAEVLVALALLSTLGLFVWAASASGEKSLRRIADGVRRNAEILELDAVVRSYAQRVLTPYWLQGPRSERAPGSLSVSYLDGSEDAALQISFGSQTLTVGDGVHSVEFKGVQDARMEITSATPQGASALKLTVRIGGAQAVTILAALGGRPFPLVGAR